MTHPPDRCSTVARSNEVLHTEHDDVANITSHQTLFSGFSKKILFRIDRKIKHPFRCRAYARLVRSPAAVCCNRASKKKLGAPCGMYLLRSTVSTVSWYSIQECIGATVESAHFMLRSVSSRMPEISVSFFSSTTTLFPRMLCQPNRSWATNIKWAQPRSVSAFPVDVIFSKE